MSHFADWLSNTSLSLTIQTHVWMIPTIQSVHIVAIGIVLASVFMIDLRVLGWAGRDQTLRETTARYGPWLSGALVVLLVTGVAMVVGEPARELLTLSFWLKMALLVVAVGVALVFRSTLGRQDQPAHAALPQARGVRLLAMLTLAVWVGIVILGRLIAYDHVWGAWSLSPGA